MDKELDMRVLIISWEYPPYVVGGMGKHVAELAPALQQINLEGEPLFVDVLSTRFGGGDAEEKVSDYLTIYRVDTPPISHRDYYNSAVACNSVLMAQARKLAWWQKYDLIHNHDWLTGPASVALKHEWKTPLLVTVHATERGRHQGYLSNQMSRQIDEVEGHTCYEAWRVIACSQFMCQEVQQYFGVPDDKVEIIANGIDMRTLNRITPEMKSEVRRRYAPNGERLLFFVGRMTHEKGLHVLLKAMPKILAKHPNTRLVVGGKNGEQFAPLARQIGIGDAVEFSGYLTDEERDHLYQSVDGAIFPSLYEPFGIVALEAMALECNVITTDVGGLGEVVDHMRNGLTVYPNDPESIAWAVDRLFASPQSASKRRNAALSEVQERYSWEVIAQETAQVYDGIVRERAEIAW